MAVFQPDPSGSEGQGNAQFDPFLEPGLAADADEPQMPDAINVRLPLFCGISKCQVTLFEFFTHVYSGKPEGMYSSNTLWLNVLPALL